MLREMQYELIHKKCQESAINTLWEIFNPSHSAWTGLKGLGFENFSRRREAFLWTLERLLREGHIKLHKNGKILELPIKEQIEAFRKFWPKTDKPYPNHPDADFYLWFFDPECPAGIAWRKEDGSYEIAD
jgi:hypothetical protein